MNISEIEPTEVIAGDTIQWNRKNLTVDYPSASWTLAYKLLGPSNIGPINATGNGDGTFSVSITATISGGYTKGDYLLIGTVTNTGTGFVKRIYEAILKIKQNLVAVTSGDFDPRTPAKIALDEAMTVFNSLTQYKEIWSNGRRYVQRDMPEIIARIDRLKLEVSKEEADQRIQQGLKTKRQIGLRFQRI